VESANAVGKTHCAARVALWWLRCHLGAEVYLASAPPEDNLRNILWGEVGNALTRCDPAFKEGLDQKVLRLSYGDKYLMAGVTIPASGTPAERQGRFSGKHSPYLLFVFDEADAIPMEVFNGAESCMSGGTARMLIMLNPRHPSGWVYELRRGTEASIIQLSAFSHPNVLTGEDIIPGAVTRETTVNRINAWSRPLMKSEKIDPARTFVIPDYLDSAYTLNSDGSPKKPLKGGQVRVVLNAQLDHMVLGRYSGLAGKQLIPQELVKRAQDNWRKWVEEHGESPPLDTKPILGLDVGVFDQDENALCIRYGNYVAPLLGWRGLDVKETGEQVAQIVEGIEAGYESIFIDSLGAGTGVPRTIRDTGLARVYGVEVSNKPLSTPKDDNGIPIGRFYSLRDELWWKCREWLRLNKDAMLPEDSELEADLTSITYDENFRGKIKVLDKPHVRKIIGRSPNRGDALVLTFSPPKQFHIGMI